MPSLGMIVESLRRPVDPAGRRRFLAWLGGLVSLGAFGCRWKPRHQRSAPAGPDGTEPGKWRQYATALELDQVATGILVLTYDGRPIKVEGNPAHPDSRGGSSVLAQALVCQLYDPARSRSVLERGGSGWQQSNWAAFDAMWRRHRSELSRRGGAGLWLVCGKSSSPTRARLLRRWNKVYPEARVCEYEPWPRDNEQRGTVLAFGEPCRVLRSLEGVKVLLCLDPDPGTWSGGSVGWVRALAGSRDPEQADPLRVYVAESSWSLIGSLADHRVAIPSRAIAGLAMALDAELGARLDPEGASGPAQPRPPSTLLEQGPVSSFLRRLLEDLLRHRGRSLVVVGRHQPAAVHALGHRLNHLLGNVGRSTSYLSDPDAAPVDQMASLRRLVDELRAGRVSTVVMLGVDPLHDLPADLQLGPELGRARLVIHAGLYRDPGAELATWHLPLAHPLESWGDGRASDGMLTFLQPVLDPLFSVRSELELLGCLLGESFRSGQDLVRETHRELLPDDKSWHQAVHDGLWPGTELSAIEPRLRPLPTLSLPEPSGLELSFAPDHRIYDGRFAGLAVLEELPDPIGGLCWGNAALISPDTAARLGVEDGAEVSISLGGRSITIPALVIPGQASGSVRLTLGHGRKVERFLPGNRGPTREAFGTDVGVLRTSSQFFLADGASIVPAGRRPELARSQPMLGTERLANRMAAERIPQLVREVSSSARPAWQPPRPEVAADPLPPPSGQHRWGLVVDLNKCIGCQTCVVACQIENNIPSVGKPETRRGRALWWLRVDRYFVSGQQGEVRLFWQPLMCQQCETAPCEQVCPVGATLHNREGLNDMVYSRCVGARYCANNCPYKVRRFNYFAYAWRPGSAGYEQVRLGLNPEVSVRCRGVMEKCSFCVQRIERGKRQARSERRSLRDGEVRLACEQACPTGALVFGDLSDPSSRVSRLFGLDRAYTLLNDLGTRPRVRYLARVTQRGAG